MASPPAPMAASRHGSGHSGLSSRSTSLSQYQDGDAGNESIIAAGGAEQAGGKHKKGQTSSACVIV